MNEATIQLVTDEIAELAIGRGFGKIHLLPGNTVIADLGIRGDLRLLISADPGNPRIHLVRRKAGDLQKLSVPDTAFVAALRKATYGYKIDVVRKLRGERIVEISFAPSEAAYETGELRLVAQLTGRSANIFLVDDGAKITDSIRSTRGDGQERGTVYAPPARKGPAPAQGDPFDKAGFPTISEALDDHFLRQEATKEAEETARRALAAASAKLKKLRRLKKKLRQDLEGHGDPSTWKRFGDLLLANASTAERTEAGYVVTDYFDESAPLIEIAADTAVSVTEAAEMYFRKYTKARNARSQIEARLLEIERDISTAEEELETTRSAIEAGDLDLALKVSGAGKRKKHKRAGKKGGGIQCARKFISSDGYEILVGKGSKDNDQLTFRIARSLDTWMHAADYPGSHVVIRRKDKKEIPHNTVLEAARLAAFYSKARGESKAAVHYTERKFVNKPRGARPGLVSLSGFKTLLVEPGIPEAVSQADGKN